MRIFILLIAVCILISGCGKDIQADAAKISGFSPVVDIIPDWDDRRKISFKSLYKFKDGTETIGTGPERFKCENAEKRSYSLIETSTGQLMSAVAEEDPLVIPDDLRQVLSELADKVEDGEFQSQGDMFLYHARGLPVDFVKFDDGWLVAYERGEWGGMLMWIEPNGVMKLLSENNSNDLLLHNDKVYVAQGLSHMGIQQGNILMVTKVGKRFAQETIPSPSAVYKLDAQDDKLVGLLANGIIYIDANDTVHFNRLNYKDPIGFRPKRVGFLSSGDVYIGGTNMVGIYSALPATRQLNLYIPNDCKVIFEGIVKL